MRNLKRALSLTLASVMLLGMMVIGTSAASYPDVTEEHNVEAIEVLQAVGVMSGSDSGNFNPDSKVSRIEMAVVMSNLLNLKVDYFENQCRFTDVPAWAGKYVAACEASGIVSGIGNNQFGTGNVTATQAALMMLKALGYFQYASDFNGGWEQQTAKLAANLSLFKGMTDVANVTELTRNQVAQLALNTLKTPVVVPEDNTLHITGGSGDTNINITGGSVNYVVTASSQPYASAIIDDLFADGDTLNGVQGCIIELGEKLYDGKLQLNDSVGVYDDFGRPARRWQYDGTTFGTYAKKEQLRQEYTKKVTGKNLYDLLGSDIVRSIESNGQWDLNVTVDGETEYATLSPYGNGYFSIKSITRTNTDAVGETGNGTLTQVYVDSIHHQVDIAVINTYLAIAEQDYNSKDEDVDLRVYHISDDKGVANDGKYVKFNHETQNSEEIITANGEDFAITEVKDGDKFLVTVAQGEIQSMTKPEIISETTLNTFKKTDWVKNDDAQYDYSTTARYDVEVLDQYDQSNMKDVTYNVILDQYGYLVGIELNEQLNQYLFLAGMDLGSSNLSAKNAEANVIFLDGTMKTVTVRVDKSQIAKRINGKFTVTGGTDDISNIDPAPAWDATGTQTAPTNDAGKSMSQINTWCTYSVDGDGVYTLKQVGNYSKARSAAAPDTVKGAKKIAQSSMDMSNLVIDTEKANELVISGKTVSLEGSLARNETTHGDFKYVYGNDETVYINTTLKKVNARGTDGVRAIIDKVDSVTTGVKNVDMTIKNLTNTPVSLAGSKVPKDEVYILYKDNGYIIGVVTLGAVDNGTTSKWAYITGEVNEEGYLGNSQWKWSKNAIIDGKKVVLTEVDDSLTILDNNKTEQGKWYSLRFNADGNVVGIKDEDTGTGENEIDFNYAPNVGASRAPDKFVTSVAEAREASNKMGSFAEKFSTVLMMTNYTCSVVAGHAGPGKREMKFEAGTLYTDRNVNNINDEGFQVSPNANIVLITSKGHNVKVWNSIVDGYVGWEGMDEAIKALNSETSGGWSAFDGYLMATFSNGIATSVILHDQSGNGKNAPTESGKPMTLNVTIVDDAGATIGTRKIAWNGSDTLASIIGAISGYTPGAETLPAFKEGTEGNAQIVYNRAKTMQVMVEYYKDSVSGSPVYTEVKTVAADLPVPGDNVLKVSTAAGADVDLQVTAPAGYVFPTAAQTETKFFTPNGRETVKFVVKEELTITLDSVETKIADGTTIKDLYEQKYGTGKSSDNVWVEYDAVDPTGGPAVPAAAVKSSATTALKTGDSLKLNDRYVKLNSTVTPAKGDLTGLTSAQVTVTSTLKNGWATTIGSDANLLKVGTDVTIVVGVSNAQASETNTSKLVGTLTATGGLELTKKAEPATNGDVVAAGTDLEQNPVSNVEIVYTVALPDSEACSVASPAFTLTVADAA